MDKSRPTKVVIVMGVSGSGKSTIGKMLSDFTGFPFYDGDDFHPEENVAKMSAGIPLQDEDRMGWLEKLSHAIADWSKDRGGILACSALKESYRHILNKGSDHIEWIYLNGDIQTISNRLEQRSDHYMPSNLLRSQFDDLEVPTYGHHVKITHPPEIIIKEILLKLKIMEKSFFGVVGLAVMGRSISLNIAERGHALSVYNRVEEAELVSQLLENNPEFTNIRGYTDLQMFVDSMARPRKILMMIKAGEAVDEMIEKLLPILEEGDVVIDGGNSHYLDTKRRTERLAAAGLHFVGSGVSGGEEGARRGPSIMPGGSKYSYDQISPVLESISAKDKEGQPCCTYIGPGGAGHFVKMVHNGIEYAEMQLLAEVYDLLKGSMEYSKISQLFSTWNSGELSSYLLEITANILKHKDDNGQDYLLDKILDKAGNKGTGSWSSKAAFDLGSVNNMMSSAVFARYVSSYKDKRVEVANIVSIDRRNVKVDLESLKQAYAFARIINHHQGYELMRQASDSYDWDLNFSEISRIWTNGCIIRSAFMQDCIEIFKKEKSLLDSNKLLSELSQKEDAVSTVLKSGIDQRKPLPSFSNAHNYWLSMTSDRLPANLIQAQRDYFGAHTYKRTDDDSGKAYHTHWY